MSKLSAAFTDVHFAFRQMRIASLLSRKKYCTLTVQFEMSRILSVSDGVKATVLRQAPF
jgi:hypothetical protein